MAELIIKLEEDCWRCNGGRDEYEGVKPANCPYCKAVGKVPTEFGLEILEFVKKHLKLTGEKP